MNETETAIDDVPRPANRARSIKGARLSIRRVALTALAAGAALSAAAVEARADRIVLRNLQVIDGPQVTGLDADGVRLSDGRTVTWDEIERLRVAPERQAEADRWLAAVGTHLYRIRQRLAVGDYEGLLPHAEAVERYYVGRSSNTAYMVHQALMWGRLAAGRREAAVAPYLRCYEFLRSAGRSGPPLPGGRRLRFDAATGMSPDLTPVWFDAEAARAALPEVLAAISAMRPPPPVAARIYYGTLALTAGERDRGLSVLEGIVSDQLAAAQWKTLALAQAEVLSGAPGPMLARVEAALDGLGEDSRVAALYLLGLARTARSDPAERQEGVLLLLKIPALYGKTYPVLAGAALFAAMETLGELGDARGRAALRRELLERYGHTFHAAKERSASPAAQGAVEAAAPR